MENDHTENRDLRNLIDKYMNNTCSREEFEQILRATEEEETELLEALRLQWDKTGQNSLPNEAHWNELYSSVMDTAKKMESVINREAVTEADPKVHKIGGVRQRLMIRVAAAAAVILALSTTIFLLFRKDHREIAQGTQTSVGSPDIAPGGNKAILTLADNSTIVLDNAQKGNLTQQGKTRILKLDNGQLAYNTSGEAKEVLYNTITTPRGGKYQVTLSDGSQVWLNAASSIKFPVAFIGNERKVEITGEAYFEVAKDPSKRFIVDANGITTEVLGTHFNINSYANEGSTKVTLIEGSVKVESGNGRESVVIKPGQQAQIADKISVENNVDIEQVLAWKNGQFVLKGTDVAALMRQVERWYDVDVIFAGKIPERKFGGSVSQTVNLSVVLQALKEYNVMCRVEGKKVIVD